MNRRQLSEDEARLFDCVLAAYLLAIDARGRIDRRRLPELPPAVELFFRRTLRQLAQADATQIYADETGTDGADLMGWL
jgi:hypothetical protein